MLIGDHCIVISRYWVVVGDDWGLTASYCTVIGDHCIGIASDCMAVGVYWMAIGDHCVVTSGCCTGISIDCTAGSCYCAGFGHGGGFLLCFGRDFSYGFMVLDTLG